MLSQYHIHAGDISIISARGYGILPEGLKLPDKMEQLSVYNQLPGVSPVVWQ